MLCCLGISCTNGVYITLYSDDCYIQTMRMRFAVNSERHGINRKNSESNIANAYRYQLRRKSLNSNVDEFGEENNFDTLVAMNRCYLASLIAIYQDLIVKKQYDTFESIVQFHREQGWFAAMYVM